MFPMTQKSPWQRKLSGTFSEQYFQERLGVLAVTCAARKRLSTTHGCDPPCLCMRNNAPVEHCVAETFIPQFYL